MDDILNTILKDTYSLSQLKHRLTILKAYLQQSLFGSQKQQIDPNDLTWLKTLPADFFQNFNINNAYTIFADIEKTITTIKTLAIYLTFEPDETTLTKIGQMVRKLFGHILLDVKFDPNLVAGTAFVWKGVYRDYSLHSRIETRKVEILGSFKKYLRK